MNQKIKDDITLLENMHKTKEINEIHLSVLEFIVGEMEINNIIPTPKNIYEYIKNIEIPHIFNHRKETNTF